MQEIKKPLSTGIQLNKFKELAKEVAPDATEFAFDDALKAVSKHKRKLPKAK